jgi:hypothetical protein
MKKVLTVLLMTFALNVYASEVKEVCHDKVDKAGKPITGKDGKVVQDCKKIKIHKKLEGTEVPVKK